MFIVIVLSDKVYLHTLDASSENAALAIIRTDNYYPTWARFHAFDVSPNDLLTDSTLIATIHSTIMPILRDERRSL